MCGLILVGLGLGGVEGLTLGSVDLLSAADVVYLESYTSPVDEDVVRGIQEKVGKPASPVSREYVEDGRMILDRAVTAEVALIVPGDPLVATTHSDLRSRALQRGVKVKILHNASIISALPGETGLHSYKFGKTVTLTQAQPVMMLTAYRTVFENLLRGLHTVLLLEYDHAARSFLPPGDALGALAELEREERGSVFPDAAFIIVASRVGRGDGSIVGGPLTHLAMAPFADPPHSIVVPGSLHFTEEEALRALGFDAGFIVDNSLRVKRKAVRMVPRYVGKTRQALQRARARCSAEELRGLKDLFENVECYVSDAERFLTQGEDELAMLSIGYGEGLLDALRLTGELAVEW